MAKDKIDFGTFVECIPEQYTEFVVNLNDYLLDNDCTYDIKEAKSGFVVSYIYKLTKKTIANYVFRKKGPQLRIYADHISSYQGVLDEFPNKMKESIISASPCKRMLNPTSCNQRCMMGFDFILDGERQQKCRNNCFLFFLSDENNGYLKQIIENEISYRKI